MSGRILVIDEIATNRIVMKVKLAAACYDIRQAATLADARQMMPQIKPDLVFAGIASQKAGLALARSLRPKPMRPKTPLILTSDRLTRDERFQLLAEGVDEILTRPLDEVFLLARIRSLLRARDVSEELRLREGTTRALGFAESAPRFEPPARIALVTNDFARAAIWRRDLEAEIAGNIEICAPSAALAQRKGHPAPDAMVLAEGGEMGDADVLAALPELRARSESRHVALIAVLSDGQHKNAVMALDLGANDVLTDGFDAKELALRLKAQLRRKRDTDRLRATVEDGLKLAVTDPLTGLYNRRYALPHLARMSEQAKTSGRKFAVMVADLDRFKQVNDRYGHQAGDMVLVEVARRLRENLRGIDLISRIGGEEFLIAMPETSRTEALVAAERLRRLMKNIPIALHGPHKPISVTLSIGVAMGPLVRRHGEKSADAVSSLMEAADKALYASKTEGRDQVTVSLSAA